MPYEAALQTALVNAKVAEALLATTQLTYDSKQGLYRQNVASTFGISTAKNFLLTTQAQLVQVKVQEMSACNNLSYTLMKSPAGGVVDTLPYRVGALVSASLSESLTAVSDNSDIYVYFSMTESQLLRLVRRYESKEKALKQAPEIGLQLNGRSDYPQAGQIETISGVIGHTTGTVNLRTVFPNQEGLLYSGGAGNVVMPTEKTGALVVPQTAAFEVQDKVFVYRVAGGKAQSAPVRMTCVNGGQEYIVKSELQTGDVIVAEGVGLLREGVEIEAVNEER